MNLKISYFYRSDDGRYNFSEDLILSGDLSDAELAQLVQSVECNGSSYFIPYRVGLPHLSPIRDTNFDALMRALSRAKSNEEKESIDRNDHPWHEIIFVQRTNQMPNIEIATRHFFEQMIEQQFSVFYRNQY